MPNFRRRLSPWLALLPALSLARAECRRAGTREYFRQRDARKIRPPHGGVRLRQARSHDSDARRREAQDLHPRPEGREGCADPPDAHAVQRRGARLALQQPAPARGRSADERHRGRGRLHHRVPGRARKIRLGRRLCDDAPAARAAQPDRGRSRDRLLRHDRVAREERARKQRPRRHDRRLLRGLHDGDVDRAIRIRRSRPRCRSRRWSTAGSATTGSTTAPSARSRHARVHLQPAGDAQRRGQVVVGRIRHLRRRSCARARPARWRSRAVSSSSASGGRSPSTRPTTRGGRSRRSTSCSRRSR